MSSREFLKTVMESRECDDAISDIKKYLVSNTGDDVAYYYLGRLYWQSGKKAEAINCYRRAMDINPESPARHALTLADEVFSFFNPDLLNP